MNSLMPSWGGSVVPIALRRVPGRGVTGTQQLGEVLQGNADFFETEPDLGALAFLGAAAADRTITFLGFPDARQPPSRLPCVVFYFTGPIENVIEQLFCVI
ncbi:hypothetical protein ACWDYH_08170 [Nocardia goodfellowii]